MLIESLSLRHFRNLLALEMQPHPKLNFLIGANGQGKTSVLEAIHLLSQLRSFRQPQAQHWMHWEANHAHLKCQVVMQAEASTDSPELARLTSEIELHLQRTEQTVKRLALINQKVYRSHSEFLQQRFQRIPLGFQTVVFHPGDQSLVQGTPQQRRHYLNQVISTESQTTLLAVIQYQKVLQQRNALLKSLQKIDSTLLDGFTSILSGLGASVYLNRALWVNRANQMLPSLYYQISQTEGFLQIGLRSKLNLDSFAPQIAKLPSLAPHFARQAQDSLLESLGTLLGERYRQVKESEIRMQQTLLGPHRDDWCLSLNRQALVNCGSQGEIKTSLLALKLCEVQLLAETIGRLPVFLLDDLSSELDHNRRWFLLRFLARAPLQSFITSTDDSLLEGNVLDEGPISENPCALSRSLSLGQESQAELSTAEDSASTTKLAGVEAVDRKWLGKKFQIVAGQILSESDC